MHRSFLLSGTLPSFNDCDCPLLICFLPCLTIFMHVSVILFHLLIVDHNMYGIVYILCIHKAIKNDEFNKIKEVASHQMNLTFCTGIWTRRTDRKEELDSNKEKKAENSWMINMMGLKTKKTRKCKSQATRSRTRRRWSKYLTLQMILFKPN